MENSEHPRVVVGIDQAFQEALAGIPLDVEVIKTVAIETAPPRDRRPSGQGP